MKTDDIALMVVEESDIELDSDFDEKEVSIYDLENIFKLLSKKNLTSLKVTLIEKIQEQIKNKNQLLDSIASSKFEYIDLKKLNTKVKVKNKLLLRKPNNLILVIFLYKSKF